MPYMLVLVMEEFLPDPVEYIFILPNLNILPLPFSNIRNVLHIPSPSFPVVNMPSDDNCLEFILFFASSPVYPSLKRTLY